MTDEEKTKEQLIDELRELRSGLYKPFARNVPAGGGTGGPQPADFSCFFDTSLDAILLTTSEGTITAANPAACVMFGMSGEELTRTAPNDLIDSLPRADGRGGAPRACLDNICELSCIRRHGTRFPAEVSSVVLDGGKKAIVIVRDIRNRKRADKGLGAAYDKLLETLESITDGFAFLNREFRFTYVNRAGAEALGKTADELAGKVLWELFPNAPETRLYSEAHRVAGGIPVHFEEFYPEPLNAWFEWHAYPSWEGVALYYRDLTSGKLIQEANSTLAAIIESSDDAIIGKSLVGKILTWNRGAERIYGYAAREMIGRSISILAPEDRHDDVPAILEKIRRNESIDHYEAVRRTKDGRHIHVSLSVSPIHNASGKIIGASSIGRDITERKLMEDALRRAYEELETRVAQRTLELAEKSAHLEEINTALRVLLKQREDDKRDLSESILSNVRNLVSPYIDRLKNSKLSGNNATLVKILASHLEEITSPFSRTLGIQHAALTPTEIQIAALIRDGKPTAEIAEVLCISDKTVSCHRANIRKKFGLQGSRNNLRSYLLSIA